MAIKSDIERYRTNYLAEQDGSELYQSLSKTERDPHLAELYRRMAETEQRHASIWADYLRKAGEPVPTYTSGWRIRMIIWLAKRFGVNSVLPMVSSMESGASHDYDTQPEARAAGMAKDERSHERLFRSVEITGGGVAGPALASRAVTVAQVVMHFVLLYWEQVMVSPPTSVLSWALRGPISQGIPFYSQV